MSKSQRTTACIKDNLLTVLTIIGVVGGTIFGLILRGSQETKWKQRDVMYVQFFGDLFLRMLKGLIIPLLVASIISAIGSLDLSLSKKIGARAIIWYATTTVLAVIQGIILVSIIRPGRADVHTFEDINVTSRNVTTVDTLLDLVRNMFPQNIVQACTSQYRTVLTKPPGATDETSIFDWTISYEQVDNSNVLGLVVFSVFCGIAIGQVGAPAKPLLNFFQSLGEVVMLMTNWVIWLSPAGVFFLVASKFVEMADFGTMMSQLGLYFATVLLGLFIHGFLVLPTLFLLLTRSSPVKFLINMSQAIVTAFGTASSNASLPVSINCLEEKNKCDPRVCRFVMPIGATINMDGTALYEAVAALFIAQVRNVSLSFGQVIAVSVTATMASIGAAGIPQAGLVTMVMVLDTVGLPAKDVSLILAVDWLLDRFRTTVNVIGDSLGAGIVAHVSKGELANLDEMIPISASARGKDEIANIDEMMPMSIKSRDPEDGEYDL